MENVVRTNGSNVSGTEAPEVSVLENTGERFLPGEMYSAEMAYDHLTRYRLAERYVEGKEIIDMGCGAGYGTHSLSRLARSIKGVDLSAEAVAYAGSRYRAPNLRYETGNVTALPYEDGSFEAAISFEVIEHLERPEALVMEAKRLLRDNGVFVVSTPDRQTYSNNRSLVNRHHLSEMYPLEFRELLERSFEHVQIYRQGSLAGSIVAPDPDELPGNGRVNLESAQFSLLEPGFGDGFPATFYMVAVCTNGTAPETLDQPLLILDRDRQVYEEADDRQAMLRHVRMYHDYRHQNANKLLRQANERLGRVRREADESLARVRREGNKRLQEAHRQLRQVRQEKKDMQSSRGWQVASGINVALTRVHAAAARIRGILRNGE